MPMTADESRETVEIMLHYLSPREARAFALAMWQRIGSKTENSSVRETLDSIRHIADGQKLPVVPRPAYILWWITFLLHWFFGLANVTAALVLAACALVPSWVAPEWCLACPVVTFILWTVVSRTFDCPFTIAEDSLRQYYGLPTVKAFLSVYLVRPLRRAWQPPAAPVAPAVEENSPLP